MRHVQDALESYESDELYAKQIKLHERHIRDGRYTIDRLKDTIFERLDELQSDEGRTAHSAEECSDALRQISSFISRTWERYSSIIERLSSFEITEKQKERLTRGRAADALGIKKLLATISSLQSEQEAFKNSLGLRLITILMAYVPAASYHTAEKLKFNAQQLAELQQKLQQRPQAFNSYVLPDFADFREQVTPLFTHYEEYKPLISEHQTLTRSLDKLRDTLTNHPACQELGTILGISIHELATPIDTLYPHKSEQEWKQTQQEVRTRFSSCASAIGEALVNEATAFRERITPRITDLAAKTGRTHTTERNAILEKHNGFAEELLQKQRLFSQDFASEFALHGKFSEARIIIDGLLDSVLRQPAPASKPRTRKRSSGSKK